MEHNVHGQEPYTSPSIPECLLSAQAFNRPAGSRGVAVPDRPAGYCTSRTLTGVRTSVGAWLRPIKRPGKGGEASHGGCDSSSSGSSGKKSGRSTSASASGSPDSSSSGGSGVRSASGSSSGGAHYDPEIDRCREKKGQFTECADERRRAAAGAALRAVPGSPRAGPPVGTDDLSSF